MPNKDKWFLFNLIEYEHLENIFSVSDEMALLGGLLDRHDEGVFSILLEYRGYWDHFVAKHSIADFEKVSDSYTSIAFIDKWDKIIGSMEHDRWLIRGDKLKVREIDNKIQKALKQFEKEYKQYEDVMLLKFYKSLAVTEEKFLKLGMGLNRELFNEMMKNNYFLRSSK
ncbi:hypothetical protein KBD45_02195 [Candidatus Dojkabacteria bacterium]|nr:hypothetical protein [Candidatus Dojkabacteria bacterium]